MTMTRLTERPALLSVEARSLGAKEIVTLPSGVSYVSRGVRWVRLSICPTCRHDRMDGYPHSCWSRCFTCQSPVPFGSTVCTDCLEAGDSDLDVDRADQGGLITDEHA